MRAQQKGLVELNIINLRGYAVGKHKSVDDMCYGGGAGMVMKAEPILRAVDKLQRGILLKKKIKAVPQPIKYLVQLIILQINYPLNCKNKTPQNGLL